MRVPHLRRLVLAAGDDPLAVGLNATLSDRSGVPLESEDSWPVSASHTFAVLSQLPVTIRVPSGLNATLLHPARVPLEGEEILARLGVPHLRRFVPTPGDDARAVGAERHAAHHVCAP